MPAMAPARIQKMALRSVAQMARQQHDRGRQRERGRHREQHASLGQQLQVLVVRVVEEELPRRLLVHQHPLLEGAGADAGPAEVARHPPRVVPDDAASPFAELGRFLHAQRERAQVGVSVANATIATSPATIQARPRAARQARPRQQDEDEQADRAAEDAATRQRAEQAAGHQHGRSAEPQLRRVDRPAAGAVPAVAIRGAPRRSR